MARPVLQLTVEYTVNREKDGGSPTAGLQRMQMAFERAGMELAKPGNHIYPLVFVVLEKFAKRQFRGEGIGPNRGKWAPLTPRYAEWKRKRFGNKPILVRTGALREALTDSNSPHAMRVYGTTGMAYGTHGLEYANYHQTGTQDSRGRQRMVDRPPLDFDEKFEKQLRTAVLKGVRAAIRYAGIDEHIPMPSDEGDE